MPTLLLLLAATLPVAATAQAPLFADDDLLEVALAVDFDALCRPRETEDCDFTPTTLQYRERDGQKHSLPVSIKIRGGWRSLSRNCSVPLLWVQFDEQDVAGTLFEGQSLLPLTTHCGKGLALDPMLSGIRRADYEQYVLREYLGHRLYNALTDYSLRVRLLRIAYPRPGSNRGVPHYAFFAEHFDAAAARTGTVRPERGAFDAERLDPQAAGLLALFQYMIGNTDWSIARERNTMLLVDAEGRQLPVPYDLDMSGLVHAKYAGPAPGLPIDDVRERWFLGYCQPGTDWDALFARFDDRRAELLALADTVPGASRNSLRSTRTFLEGFFDMLDAPDERQARIVDSCQPWPPTGVDHTSPLEPGRGRGAK
ncbi:MAG: hypothetical protein R3233_09070 [Xanthomonadales bacterium]|nr:hypothetical protein [Xanthomonadales bacterium]